MGRSTASHSSERARKTAGRLNSKPALIGLGVLFACAFLTSAAALGAPEGLSPGPARIDLSSHVSVLDDPDGVWTIQDVTSPPLSQRFTPNTTSLLSLYSIPGRIWVRFKLRGTVPDTSVKTRLVLEIDSSIVDEVELYVPDASKETGFRLITSANAKGGPSGLLNFRNFAYPLDEQASREKFYYLRLGCYAPSTAPLVLWAGEAFRTHTMYDYFVFGLIYGTMLGMILYYLFIFFTLGNRIYLIYVCYILSFLIYCLFLNGHIISTLNLSSDITQVWEWIFLGGTIFFSICFCQRFFNTKANTPFWYWVLVFFQAVALSLILIGLLRWHEAAALVAYAAGVIGPVNFTIVAVIRWCQGFGSAKFYILANWSFVAGTMIYVFWAIGLLPADLPSNMLFALGPAIEAVLLSFALADRIRVLEKEKLVLAKTQAQYKRASETDGLTGLFNISYLTRRLKVEAREATMTGQPLSFLIMDVDDFKLFNDTYGHPEGDIVLQTLAEVITDEIRDRDVGCRYGGEEFTVILPDVEKAQAWNVAERIRRAFAARTFHPQAGPGVSVTVSIGLAQLNPGEAPADLIRRADQALYRAKNQGKNQVVMASD
jgi:diguanylate cyclase (GGDEF)-like protein